MTVVLFIEAVPHIVRYGMHSESKGKSWMHFYRNGVQFNISISEIDIKDTPFHGKWRPLIEERKDFSLETRDLFYNKWRDHCSCVLNQAMPILREFAPDTHQWITLEDHLKTPTYELKLTTSPDVEDAIAVIDSGPVLEPSFDLRPMVFKDLHFEVPEDLSHIPATDLIVLDQARDHRQAPYKVRFSGSGPNKDRIFFFRPVERPRKDVMTKIVINQSLDSIKTHLEVHKLGLHKTYPNLRIPRVIGIVTTSEKQGNEEESKTQFAGLLHEYLPHALSLSILSGLQKPDHLNLQYKPLPGTGPKTITIATPPTTTQLKAWKSQLHTILEILHSHDIVAATVGESETYVPCVGEPGNEELVAAGTDAEAWLTDVGGMGMAEHPYRLPKDTDPKKESEKSKEQKLSEAKQKDMEQLESMFERVREKLSHI